MCSHSIVIAILAVFSKLPYDSIKDLAPVSLVAESPFVLLVHPSLPVRPIHS